MRVAILGAGFAGLSVAHFLLHYKLGSVSIDIYDPQPLGAGVSGLSSGLLHTFPGKEARQSWRAYHCMRDAHRLITIASQGVDQSVILSKGILRPALTEQQQNAFRACAEKFHDETEWWESRRCMDQIPGLFVPEESGGLYIKNGFTIDVQAYLEGLWQNLAKFGVQFIKSLKVGKKMLEDYDQILVAMGANTRNVPELQSLPITPIKGQLLDLEWPEGVAPLPFSLISHKYLVMSKDLKSCTVGATFERSFETPNLDQAVAAAEILPHITSYFPALEKAKILGCRGGFRAATPSHLPLAGRASEKLYYVTGLGSKGLLYHAWVGKRIARAMVSQKTEHIPSDIRHNIE